MDNEKLSSKSRYMQNSIGQIVWIWTLEKMLLIKCLKRLSNMKYKKDGNIHSSDHEHVYTHLSITRRGYYDLPFLVRYSSIRLLWFYLYIFLATSQPVNLSIRLLFANMQYPKWVVITRNGPFSRYAFQHSFIYRQRFSDS